MKRSVFAFVLAVILVVFFVKLGNNLLSSSDSSDDIGELDTNPISEETFEEVSWHYEENLWKVSGVAKACPEKIIESTPVDISLVTSVLYPGQVRGGDYKPHGGFRFDNSDNEDIKVIAPMEAYVVRGSRYLKDGEIQYMFEMINPCGIMYRFDHLRVLSPKFERIAEEFREASEGDSRTTNVNLVGVKSGETIATAVGIKNTQNVFLDFGLYDLRKKNSASKNPNWLDEHGGEFAPYALCWINFLPEEDKIIIKSLPGADGVSGKKSDYCL